MIYGGSAMNRAQALKTLNLTEGCDGHDVETSYWTLVRHAQARDDEASASREVEQLNRAYALLAPAPGPMVMAPRKPPPGRRTAFTSSAQGTAASARASGENVVDTLLAWFGTEAARVRERWSGRNPEIALISGAVVALAVLSLAAGASVVVVLICMVLVALGVWSPWRDGSPPDGDDG